MKTLFLLLAILPGFAQANFSCHVETDDLPEGIRGLSLSGNTLRVSYVESEYSLPRSSAGISADGLSYSAQNAQARYSESGESATAQVTFSLTMQADRRSGTLSIFGEPAQTVRCK